MNVSAAASDPLACQRVAFLLKSARSDRRRGSVRDRGGNRDSVRPLSFRSKSSRSLRFAARVPLWAAVGWLLTSSVSAADDLSPPLPVPSEAVAEAVAEADSDDFVLLDHSVARGTTARLGMSISESFAGSQVETPVVVIHGREKGTTLCVVAGIHGDEVNGVEVVRRLVNSVSPISLRGTLIAVPIANLSAFRRGSRYLPDRRDLNRYFPGRMFGSSASRIARHLFESVIRRCDAVVDLHTGSFHRSNLHQLRADLSQPATLQLAADFGGAVVVNNAGRVGTLRRATTDVGIPAITLEAGEPTRFEEAQVVEALTGLIRLMTAREMIGDPIVQPEPTPKPRPTIAYLGTRWVRSDQGGILVSHVELGDEIERGQILGTISDPLSEDVEAVVSPVSGRLLGMALDQVVMPGFAAYHIGFESHPIDQTGVVKPTQLGPADALDPEALDLEERPE